MDSPSPILWRQAYNELREEDRVVVPPTFATKPEELILEVEGYISHSKINGVKLPNGEKLFVRDVLRKVSWWIKKFVEVGDVTVRYDPGHAALPWALLRLVLQTSMSNVEKYADVLEGVEQISYYLVWSRIEEACLAVPFEEHDQLQLEFVKLYIAILKFSTRSLRFLRNEPHQIATALFSSDPKFQQDMDHIASKKQSIESYARQISYQINDRQNDGILRRRDQLTDLIQPVIRVERTTQSTSTMLDRAENKAIRGWASDIPFQKHYKTALDQALTGTNQLLSQDPEFVRANNQRILDWASNIPFQKHYKTALDQALTGTGQWLFQNPEFVAWEARSRSQILWLHGPAGSGKSTLMATIIQSFIRAHDDHHAPYPNYFFCSRNTAEPERADPKYILRSLMRQTSDLTRGLPRNALRISFYNRSLHSDVSAQEAAKILISTIENRPLTYLMIDALDECDRGKRDILVDQLKTILTESNSLVKVLVTSRDSQQDIARWMDEYPAVYIDTTHNQADVDLYVQTSVQNAVRMGKLLPGGRITPDVQQAIATSLCNGADGNFRWVTLQLEFLYTLRKPSALLNRLQQLSPGLEKVYGELYEYKIHELGEEQGEVVKRVLCWLLVAEAPLRAGELCRLVAGTNEVDTIDTLLNMTFGLVRYDVEQDQFRFSHLSVREFLEKRQGEFEPVVLQSVATCMCLTILTRSTTMYVGDYAALYWPVHAENATRGGGSTLMNHQLDMFLRIENRHFIMWNWMMFRALKEKVKRKQSLIERKISQALTESGSPLLVTAYFELSTQLHRIVSDDQQPVDIEVQNIAGGRALYLASGHGSLKIIEILLNKGANINAHGGEYDTALQAASGRGHTEVVQMLLDRGADIYAQGGKYDTALQAASRRGHIEVVQILLDRGANIYAQGGKYGTALQAASRRGSPEVVQKLLDRGANVNAHGGEYDTALQAASGRGYTKVVEILLSYGAHVNAQGRHHSTALQAASRRGYTEVVQMLLDDGARFRAWEVRDGTAQSPLSFTDLTDDSDSDLDVQDIPSPLSWRPASNSIGTVQPLSKATTTSDKVVTNTEIPSIPPDWSRITPTRKQEIKSIMIQHEFLIEWQGDLYIKQEFDSKMPIHDIMVCYEQHQYIKLVSCAQFISSEYPAIMLGVFDLVQHVHEHREDACFQIVRDFGVDGAWMGLRGSSSSPDGSMTILNITVDSNWTGAIQAITDIMRRLTIVLRPTTRKFSISQVEVHSTNDSTHMALLPLTDVRVDACWHVLFTGKCIARLNHVEGQSAEALTQHELKVDFETLICLCGADDAVDRDGGICLAGIFSFLVPVEVREDDLDGRILLWHLFAVDYRSLRPSQARNALWQQSEAWFTRHQHAWFKANNIEELRGFSTHAIGWTMTSSVTLGAQDQLYNLRRSSAAPRDQVRVETTFNLGITIGYSGSSITANRANRFGRSEVHRYFDRQQHMLDCLGESVEEQVLLYEPDHQRAWLISKVFVLHHLLLERIRYTQSQPGYQPCDQTEMEQLYNQARTTDPLVVYELLKQYLDWSFPHYIGSTCQLRDVLRSIMCAFDQFEYSNWGRDHRRSFVGYEAYDAIVQTKYYRLRSANTSDHLLALRSLGGWVNLLAEVPVVLFFTGIRDPIVPHDDSERQETCQRCHQVPRNHNYMAITVNSLVQLSRKWPESFSKAKLGENAFWRYQSAWCRHKEEPHICIESRLQTIWAANTDTQPSAGHLEHARNGAVIFKPGTGLWSEFLSLV